VPLSWNEIRHRAIRFSKEWTEAKREQAEKHIHAFAFIPGYQQHKFEEQDPINIEAVEIMDSTDVPL